MKNSFRRKWNRRKSSSAKFTFGESGIGEIRLRRKWTKSKLSDDEHTPGQVKYFFENHSLTGKFSQLQSLSIIKIKGDKPYSLLSQLPSLPNLVSLEIEPLCGKNIPEFELPNLKKLIFSSCPNTSWLKVSNQVKLIELKRMDSFFISVEFCST